MKTTTVINPAIDAVEFPVRSLVPNGWFQGTRVPARRPSGMYVGRVHRTGLDALTSRYDSAPGS